MPRKIDISHKTIIFITVFLLSLWLIFLIRDLILILFVSVILMSALSPMVTFLRKLKFPKALGIAVTYIIIIAMVSGLIAIIFPPLIAETSRLFLTFPPTLNHLLDVIDVDKTVLQNQLTDLSKNVLSVTLSVFDNILTIIFLLVLTFYLLLERENLEARISYLFGSRQDRVKELIIKIEEKLGGWFRGQLLLSVIIGVLSYAGLFALSIPYALPLAVVAGLMEVVPVIGPIISAIPSIIVALTVSPLLALAVGVMYFIIQQFENNLIVPQVMKRAVGINPLVVILAIAVGSRLLGFAGALLAVPIAVVIQIIVAEVIEEKNI